MSLEINQQATAAQVLARLSRHLEHALNEVGLTLPQYRLLLFLEKRPDAANRLAANLHVRPPSLTALVDGMEARGFVDRSTDPDDRRKVRIVITEAGSNLLEEANNVTATRLSQLEGLDPQGRDLMNPLRAWSDSLNASANERQTR